MNKPFRSILFLVTIIFALINCARVGVPTGGYKDKKSPKVIYEKPKNESVNFEGNRFKIRFDEYVTLSNATANILISPPMKVPPKFKPIGPAYKYIELIFQDTLKDNTTYIIDFGKGIRDFNEGNILKNYQYVFSTGKYIDSLELSGMITNPSTKAKTRSVTLILHEVDSTYTDSSIYKDLPDYITSTIDTIPDFKFKYLKKGKYQIFGFIDANNDAKFSQNEPVAFNSTPIELPLDNPEKELDLKLFKEKPGFELKYPVLVAKNRIIFPYTSSGEDSIKIEFLYERKDPDFRYKILKQVGKDTMDFWFTPLKTFLEDPEDENKKKASKSNIIIDSLALKKDADSLWRIKLKDTILSKKDTLVLDFLKNRLLDSLKIEYIKKAKSKIIIDSIARDSIFKMIDSLAIKLRDTLLSQGKDTLNIKIDSLKLKLIDSLNIPLKFLKTEIDSTQIDTLSDKKPKKKKRKRKKRKKTAKRKRKKQPVDSLVFKVSYKSEVKDTFKVKFKRMYLDSLKLTPSQSRTLSLRDSFYIQSTTPIKKINDSLILFIDKDTLEMVYNLKYDEYKRRLNFYFDREPKQKYQMQLLPNAVEDMFGLKNDTINIFFETKSKSDYGNIYYRLSNIPRYPFLLQLMNISDNLIEEHYIEEPTEVHEFLLLPPGKYSLRIVFDDNKNRKWDTGKVLELRQPEEIYYFPEIDLRANFDWEQDFIYGIDQKE